MAQKMGLIPRLIETLRANQCYRIAKEEGETGVSCPILVLSLTLNAYLLNVHECELCPIFVCVCVCAIVLVGAPMGAQNEKDSRSHTHTHTHTQTQGEHK